MYKKFDDFLERQRAQSGLPTMDLEERKSQWLASLRDLYQLIRSFLQPYLNDQRLYFCQFHSEITEEQMGKYGVETGNIVLQGDSNGQAHLHPVGTFIIGARGRVDLTGPTGKTVKLLLVEKKAKSARTRINEPFSSYPERQKPKTEGEAEWVWKIATPPPEVEYIELSEDNFLNALMYVLER